MLVLLPVGSQSRDAGTALPPPTAAPIHPPVALPPPSPKARAKVKALDAKLASGNPGWFFKSKMASAEKVRVRGGVRMVRVRMRVR